MAFEARRRRLRGPKHIALELAARDVESVAPFRRPVVGRAGGRASVAYRIYAAGTLAERASLHPRLQAGCRARADGPLRRRHRGRQAAEALRYALDAAPRRRRGLPEQLADVGLLAGAVAARDAQACQLVFSLSA